jgi:aryl-alcohol dehydrogenase-like predicted oxidoreductase
MERRPLGDSDLEITRVGIGTAPIGSVPGHWWINWGAQDERDSRRDPRRARRRRQLDRQRGRARIHEVRDVAP